MGGDDGFAEPEDDIDEKRLVALSTEERWLRTQLLEARAGEDDVLSESEDEDLAAASPKVSHRRTGAAQGMGMVTDFNDVAETPTSLTIEGQIEEGTKSVDPMVRDIWTLIDRLRDQRQREQDGIPDEFVDDGGGSSGSEDDSPTNASPLKLSRDDAAKQLRALPHEEIRSLLAIVQENETLQRRVIEAQQELDSARERRGNPDDFLRNNGEIPEDVPEGLVIETRRKIRELGALRKRWWKDRQDDSTTVRRALAVTGIPEDDAEDDEPPAFANTSLFERIHAAMTLP